MTLLFLVSFGIWTYSVMVAGLILIVALYLLVSCSIDGVVK